MGEASRRQALLTCVLAFIDDGATAGQLAGRLAELGLGVSDARTLELLRSLADQGLVRIAASGNGEHRFVTTSLGRRLAEAIDVSAELRPRLEELERLRTDLFAAVTHELRTPLTAIRTSVSLLLDPALQPSADERQRLLRNIAVGADRMQRLVADVVDLARFRAGAIRLQLRRFDGAAMTEDVAAMCAPLYAERAQRLATEIVARPIDVYGDRQRIEQVLLNLLSNAGKFSPDAAEIRLRVEPADDQVVWSVIDSGVGIRADDRSRLFERFFTTDRRMDTGGAGLGLPISLAIAEAHGGTIEVDSEPGRGSTFQLRLPRGGPGEDEA